MGVSTIRFIKNYMVLHLPMYFNENVNTLSYLINKFVTWSLSFLMSLFPIMKRQTHGMEFESVFEEPGVLGSPLSNCANS